jgi:hypothetical protein
MLRTPDSVAARLRRWLDLGSGVPGLAISNLLLISSDSVLPAVLEERRDRSFLRRAVEWLGLAGREPPVKLEWTMSWPARTAAAPGAITLELPPGQSGTFLLTLSVATSSGSVAVSQREIAVGDG